MILRRAAFALPFLILTACRSGAYDIDRIADPVEKARYSCQYLLERQLALDSDKDADGVLRKRIADFTEPAVTREGDRARVRWSKDAIALRRDGSRHEGGCAITLRDQGRFIEAIDLDGAPVHAGFGM